MASRWEDDADDDLYYAEEQFDFLLDDAQDAGPINASVNPPPPLNVPTADRRPNPYDAALMAPGALRTRVTWFNTHHTPMAADEFDFKWLPIRVATQILTDDPKYEERGIIAAYWHNNGFPVQRLEAYMNRWFKNKTHIRHIMTLLTKDTRYLENYRYWDHHLNRWIANGRVTLGR